MEIVIEPSDHNRDIINILLTSFLGQYCKLWILVFFPYEGEKTRSVTYDTDLELG